MRMTSRRSGSFVSAAIVSVVVLPAMASGWTTTTTASTSTSTRPRGGEPSATALGGATSRRDALATAAASLTAGCVGAGRFGSAGALEEVLGDERRRYALKFPTLFAPLYGEASRETMRRSLSRNDATTADGGDDNAGDDIWALEQNLELGPLQTPIRCTVIKLRDGTLWVHAPLAPTEEFFDLVESCGGGNLGGEGSGGRGRVSHVVVPTYALEHKVFVKDCMARWPDAKLWTSPGQFSFPFRASEEFVFGKKVSGVLGDCYRGVCDGDVPPWHDEIEYATLSGGTFSIGGRPTTLRETAFFHKASKTLIVTDAVARIPRSVPPLNDPDKLLLVSKRSTSDPMPTDTLESRLAGWKKTALLVSYFFPEHEEFDPDEPGVVTWTDGWEDNFSRLSGRLVVPPVVRTLIYAQNPAGVRRWVDVVSRESGWDFDRVVPAHFDAPVEGVGPGEFANAFRFLEDADADAFPEEDLRRGLRPIADLASKRL